MRRRKIAPTTMESFDTAINEGARIVAFIPFDAYIEGYGWRVSLVIEGEAFHRPTGNWPYTSGDQVLPWFWGEGLSYHEACKIADRYNERQGVSAKDAAIIVLRSMVAGSESPARHDARARRAQHEDDNVAREAFGEEPIEAGRKVPRKASRRRGS